MTQVFFSALFRLCLHLRWMVLILYSSGWKERCSKILCLKGYCHSYQKSNVTHNQRLQPPKIHKETINMFKQTNIIFIKANICTEEAEPELDKVWLPSKDTADTAS